MRIMELDGNIEVNSLNDPLLKRDVLNLCRLCANAHDNFWPIFSGEGLANNISEKLQKYLPFIKVAESDELPSQICYQCATVLIQWHYLYEGCSVAEERLRGLLDKDEKISDEPMENHDDFRDDIDFEEPVLDENENANSEIKEEKISDSDTEKDRNDLSKNVDETEIIRKEKTSRSIARVVMKRGQVIPFCDVEDKPIERSGESSNKNSTELSSQPPAQCNILKKLDLCQVPVQKMAILVPNLRSVLPRASSVPSIPVTEIDLNSITSGARLIKLLPVGTISVASTSVENPALTEARNNDGAGCNLGSAILGRKHDLSRRTQFSHHSSDSDLPDNLSSSMHSCHYCDYRCKRKYDIKRHILSKHLKKLPASGKKLECSICDLSFQDVSTTRKHVMKAHCGAKGELPLALGEETKLNDHHSADSENEGKVISKMHPCGICNASYTRKSDFYRHLRNKHPTELDSQSENILPRKKAAVNCPYCDETAMNRNLILSHIKIAHNIDTTTPFICVLCNKTFKRKFTLNVHNATYHPREQSPEEADRILKTAEILLNGEKAFHCDICKRNMVDPIRFVAHYRLHNAERKFICDLCGKQTRTKHQLNTHVKSIHLDIRPFQCEKCLKSFKSRQSHDEHYRIHTGERPFSCEKCGKTFIAMNALLTHQKFHNDFFAHTCPMCPKKFKIRRQLTLHIYTHTKERPYQCDLCSKTFYNSSRFSYHKKVTHSDNRPFTCSLCGSCFKANKFLQRHLKLHDKRTQIQFRRRNNPTYFETQRARGTEKSRSEQIIVEPSLDNREDTIDLIPDECIREETDIELVENEDSIIIQ